ncbi:MAG: tetratricopeptide repeat protein [Acidobacteria bacterium]|nr:tetratricopeptide repeat protein [Acidobacteriota bacterium]
MSFSRRLWVSSLVVALAATLWAGWAHADWHKGVAAFQKKDFTTAVKEFQQVTKTNPDFAGGYYMLGLAQNQLGQISQALGNLRQAVKLDGKNPQYRTALGQVLLRAKQYSDAYSVLKAVNPASLKPGERTFYALLFSGAATKTNHVQDAVRVLQARIRHSSRDARLYQALGVAYATIGNDAKAAVAFEKAYQLHPNNLKLGRSAAYSYIDAGRRTSDPQKKVAYYTKAGRIGERLARSRATFEYHLLAGESWLGAKQFNRALKWLNKAHAQKPQNALVRFYRGQCYSSLGQFGQALTELRASLQLGPESRLRRQIYNQLGYVYAKQKRYDKAISAYQNAGNASKAAEMQANLKKQKHNLAAEKERRQFEQKIKALLLQAQELQKLGQVNEAKALRDQVKELQKGVKGKK